MSDRAAVPLAALSARQKRLVESHLPLVHHTLNRLDDWVARHRARGRYTELVQEGSLALIDAVRSHDPARHGPFGPYAVARIHFAVSVFVHETECAIRVPYIAQRRRRRRIRDEKSRHNPAAPPRIVRLSARHRIAAKPFSNPCGPGNPPIGAPTLGECIRDRIDRATSRVAARMAAAPRLTPVGRDVVERCAQDRWTIPEPDEKTSIREVARSLNCPPSHVMRCEERFVKRAREILSADPAFSELLSLSRRAPDGLRHRLNEKELQVLTNAIPFT
jgi:RNA polymerase sigma factor (sigma-70 family)